MKKALTQIERATIFSFLLLFTVYLVLPGPEKVPGPPDSIQSQEPGDTRDPNLRAHFTNYTRAQIMAFYQDHFSRSSLYGIPLPTFRLKLPPEDAFTVIQDQTKSSYLEEIVHPLRESLYVNGWQPDPDREAKIFVNDKQFTTKITIHQVDSNQVARLIVFLGSALAIFWLNRQVSWIDSHLLQKLWELIRK